ncbi:YodC family protein [Asticcacaulis tiandongensis]|uniref:YodC family protein n=1 Tax=Asticcacaulis tiandongensis TaxID=2565365 RepID=UPI001128B363|nr:DUF2158 domain-containing protein [Asticcacaulis tiandongensis]
MSEAFTVGDKVQLKSGGPVMIIENIDATLGKVSVECIWFDGNSEKRSSYFDYTLEKAASDK